MGLTATKHTPTPKLSRLPSRSMLRNPIPPSATPRLHSRGAISENLLHDFIRVELVGIRLQSKAMIKKKLYNSTPSQAYLAKHYRTLKRKGYRNFYVVNAVASSLAYFPPLPGCADPPQNPCIRAGGLAPGRNQRFRLLPWGVWLAVWARPRGGRVPLLVCSALGCY